jgi:imidazole glycerol-phosphate synthase subunit HisH
MIHIIDYGTGNIQAFINLFKRLGVNVQRVSSPNQLNNVDRIILPGVGHFDHAMYSLNHSGLRSKLEELVLGNQVPLLGICVGMQILANESDEGELSGLNWVPGHIRGFNNLPKISQNVRIPHMGWNELEININSKLFSKGFEEKPQFYFLHSYYFDAKNKSHVIATSNYGLNFDAAISYKNIYGVQFHPEKSHYWGEQIIKNFLVL